MNIQYTKDKENDNIKKVIITPSPQKSADNQAFKKKTFLELLREMFSENGVMSCKRVIGSIMIVLNEIALLYIIYAYGVSPIISNLLQTSMITGAALLGVYSVSSIWKKNNGNKNNDITFTQIKDKNNNTAPPQANNNERK